MLTTYAVEVPCTSEELQFLRSYSNEYLMEQIFNVMTGDYHSVINDDNLTLTMTKVVVVLSETLSGSNTGLSLSGIILTDNYFKVLYVCV